MCSEGRRMARLGLRYSAVWLNQPRRFRFLSPPLPTAATRQSGRTFHWEFPRLADASSSRRPGRRSPGSDLRPGSCNNPLAAESADEEDSSTTGPVFARGNTHWREKAMHNHREAKISKKLVL